MPYSPYIIPVSPLEKFTDNLQFSLKGHSPGCLASIETCNCKRSKALIQALSKTKPEPFYEGF